ncbi:MAG: hypothetical protein JWN32_1054 [Solirubrobacterales bacterium]|nr:hypothetical protein [Solirubrobacterales bacterium]
MTANRDHTALGAVFLVVLAVIFAAVYVHVPSKVLAPGGQVVRAVFGDTATLTKGDPVRVNGINVGAVTDLSLDPNGRTTTVTMTVHKQAQPIYADARADIRWRTLLGAEFVVDLDRGTPGSGLLRAPKISPARTSSQVQLEDVATVFAGNARRGFRTLLKESPAALANHQAPRQVFQELAAQAPDVTRGLGALRGEQSGDLRRLVANTAVVVNALGTASTTGGQGNAAHDFVQGAAATVQTTAARAPDISRTIAVGAAALPRITTTLERLSGTLALADPLIAKLHGPAGELAPSVSRLRPAVEHLRTVLTDARPLLRSLRPAATSLARSGKVGTSLLKGISPSLTWLDQIILPDLALVDPQDQRATYQVIGGTLEALGNVPAAFDQNGYFARFFASVGERAISSLPCATFLTDPNAPQRIKCDQLSAALQAVFGPPSKGSASGAKTSGATK